MAKYTREEYALIKKQKEALLKLVLIKSGVKHKEIVELAEQQFVRANLDLITPDEKKQFNRLVFSSAL